MLSTNHPPIGRVRRQAQIKRKMAEISRAELEADQEHQRIIDHYRYYSTFWTERSRRMDALDERNRRRAKARKEKRMTILLQWLGVVIATVGVGLGIYGMTKYWSW